MRGENLKASSFDGKLHDPHAQSWDAGSALDTSAVTREMTGRRQGAT
jgi:hypothetical protein